MPYEIIPNTAEVGVRATATTLEGAFSEAVRGLAAIEVAGDPPLATENVVVNLEADDLPALFEALLSETLHLFETQSLLAVDADVSVQQDKRLTGILRCAANASVTTLIKTIAPPKPALQHVDGSWQLVAYVDV